MSDPRYQVDVSVVTRYLAEQSQPEQTASPSPTPSPYRTMAVPAKLMSRHWVITDGDGHVEEVRGAGVVGQQPLIDPAKATPTAAAR
jgi:ApaG protein